MARRERTNLVQAVLLRVALRGLGLRAAIVALFLMASATPASAVKVIGGRAPAKVAKPKPAKVKKRMVAEDPPPTVIVPPPLTPPAAAPPPISVPAPAVAPQPTAPVVTPPVSQPVEARPKRAAPALLRVAVYTLELQGVAPNVGALVTESLLGEVKKLKLIQAVGMDEIRDMLSFEATKQLAGCSETADSCLADLAGALGVDELLTGKLGKVDQSSTLLLRRIDQKRAAVKATVNDRLKAGSGQEFLAAIGPAVERLFPGFELRAGASRGVAKEIALQLDPPPVPVWTTTLLGVLAAASASAGGVVSYLAYQDLQTYNRTLQPGLASQASPVPVSGPALVHLQNEGQQRALTANILFIAAGGVAVVAVVLALFTDWHGYRQARKTHVDVMR